MQIKVSLLILAILLLGALVALRLWPHGRSFDSVAWKDQQMVSQGIRLKMADDLISRKFLQGRTKTEAVKILGEPLRTSYFRDWDMVYWLGPERGFISIDSEWLVIRLDAHDRVIESRILKD